MPTLLSQIGTALQKLPGQIVGAPVDLTNMVMGAVSGKGLEGLVDKPVGGSRSINSLAGLDTPSGGLGEDVTSLIGNLATPGGMAKGVMAGMVLPARMLKTFPEYNSIVKMFKEGHTAEDIFKATGAYKVPGDDTIKAILDDTGASIMGVKRELGAQSISQPNVSQSVSMPGSLFGDKITLSDVLDHPAFWDVVNKNPELSALKQTEIGPGLMMGQGNASYNSDANRILTGSMPSTQGLTGLVLHEVQHAVQNESGMIGGGNPNMFLNSPTKVIDAAQTKLRGMMDHPDTSPAMKTELGGYYDELGKTKSQAFQGYKSLSGEAEARYTDNAFTGKIDKNALPTSQYDVDPSSLTNPASVLSKIDDDPVVKTILDHLKD